MRLLDAHKSMTRVVGIAVLGGLFAACASGPKSDMPDWIMKESGAFPGESDKIFAVGVAQGIRNISLQRQTADNRARANLQAILETYVGRLIRDYQRATSNMEASSEEIDVQSTQKTIIDGTLRGSQIVDRYLDEKDNVLYSLAVLDLNAFKDTVDKIEELDARTRDFIRENAERAAEDLDEELEQNRN